MDDVWERTNEFYSVEKLEVEQLFFEFNQSKVKSYEAILNGCRNSNYKVVTNKGIFLLRLSALNDLGYQSERAINSVIDQTINTAKLQFSLVTSKYNCLIYDYIDGRTLQELISVNEVNISDYIETIAKIAAKIHNIERDQITNLVSLELPPFKTWYTLFLNQEQTINRLGESMVNRVNELLIKNEDVIEEIDRYQSIIHSDFRPANMLINQNNDVFVIDWEFATYGHTLADIGQLFRYKQCYDASDIRKFEQVYNQIAKRQLPTNWFKLARLRELVNPLQMISVTSELPNKFGDLKAIVHDILTEFDC